MPHQTIRLIIGSQTFDIIIRSRVLADGTQRWHAVVTDRAAAEQGHATEQVPDFAAAATLEDCLAAVLSHLVRRVLTPPPAAPPNLPSQEQTVPAAPPQPAAGAVPGTVVPVRSPISFSDRAERGAQLTATVEGAISRLAEQLAAGHSAAYLELLGYFARFHRYSINNALLIQAQCPQATLVAGMRRWNELGYRVARGEKAIWILAPIIKKELDPTTGEKTEVVVAFRPASVFDASQLANLDEKPLPSLFPALPDDVDHVYQLVKGRIEAAGIVVEEVPLPPGVQGVSAGGRIGLRPGLDSRNRLFVLLHELVHEVGHRSGERAELSRATKEFEAEAVSFVVAAIFSLELPTSRDYLLSWQGTAEQLRASLNTIQRLTRQVLAIIQPADSSALAEAA